MLGCRATMLWIGIVSGVSTPARAHPIIGSAPPCWEDSPIYPALDATNVPLNTHAWFPTAMGDRLYLLDGTTRKRVDPLWHRTGSRFEVEFPELAKRTTYTLVTDHDVVVVRFTTGDTENLRTPRTPVIEQLVRVGNRTRLVLRPDPNIVGLLISFEQAKTGRLVEEYTPAVWPKEGVATRCVGGSVWTSDQCLDVRAIDGSGEFSAPARYCFGERIEEPRGPARIERRVPDESPLVTAIVVGGSLLLGILALFALDRHARSRSTAATTSTDASTVTRAARTVRAWSIGVAVLATAVMGLAALDVKLIAPGMTLLLIAITTGLRAHNVIDLMRHPLAVATNDGRYLFVNGVDAPQTWLVVSKRILERAALAPLPRARLRR